MTDQLTATTLRSPRGRGALTRLLALLLPATTSLFALALSIQQVLIPTQVEALDPANKVTNLAILTSCAAIAALVALPIGGALSDATRGRFGRRTPWLVGMGLLSAVVVATMGTIGNLVLLASVYTLLWFTANIYQAALVAILPDRVPLKKRGVASSVISLGFPLGILIGVNFAANVSQGAAYVGVGIFLVVATLALVLGSPEGPFVRADRVTAARTKFSPASVGRFFNAFSSRSFTLAFFSRALLFLSYFVVSGYLLYTLQDHIGVEKLPRSSATAAISIVTTIQTLTWIVVASFAGWLADRLDRRKLFVAISSIGMGCSMIIPVLSPSWNGMLVYAVLSGGFFGCYMAVDLALMSLVLPNKDSEGRDLGILTIATGAPQLLSSVIASALITFAGGYTTLFAFGAVVAIIAGLCVLPIRTVR
ncbi:MFS transporter [Rhodococcus sp. SC4]|nr:MFS transporter [Rhodococcus sp. SC4]